MKLPYPTIDRTGVCDALCHILGNTCRIYRTTLSYSWNVSGRGGELARNTLHEQAHDLGQCIAPMALHILGLGGQAIFDYTDEIIQVDPPTKEDIPSVPEMLNQLRDGHKQATLSIGAAIDLAREIEELATMNLLSGQIDLHRIQKHRLDVLTSEF